MTLLHDARGSAGSTGSPGAAAARWPNYRTPYRPDIEGLRAVAVLTVVAFHASLPFVPGGFIGVDIFFVISGFLITSLMLTEAADSGRVSLRDFFARRARRILPGAATVLVVTGLASWALLPLLRVRDVAQDLALSSLYASNWRFIAVGTDYLAENRAPSPFLHYWSLAVEEQFYLVWPLVLAGLVVFGRRRGRNSALMIAVAIAMLTVASLALSLRLTHTAPAVAYMASPTRAWQFGIGALIAVAGPWLARASGVARALVAPLGWLGFAALVWATIHFTSKTSYPGVAALVPTFGTAAIVLSGTVWQRGSGPTIGRALGIRPLRGIGRLSYAWYLWHWPAIVLVQARFGVLSWPVQALVMLAATLPAWLTLRLVERPIRFSRAANTKASSGLAIGVTATVLSLIAGLGVGSAATRTLAGPTAAVTPSLSSVFDKAKDGLNSGSVTPGALAARKDFPRGQCIADQTSTQVTECRFGKSGGPLAVLFGDSHAHQWQPAFDNLVGKRGWSLAVITHAGCPVAPLPRGTNATEAACNTWREKAVARIKELHPALIIVSSYSKFLWRTADRLPAWKLELGILRQTGAKISYLVDTPTPNKDVPVCISAHLDNWSACAFKRSDGVWPDPVRAAVLRGNEPGVSIIDLTSYLCPKAMCPSVRGGVVFYRDATHITATLAAVMQPAMAAAFDAAGLMVPPTKS